MENLEDKVKKFLAIDIGFGIINAYITFSTEGYGRGLGSGFGCESSRGAGHYFENNRGQGHGSGVGGDNYSGYGFGLGYDIKELNGDKVYLVDGIQTIFTSIHENVAKGYILQSDLQLKPCFIVKENNKFAHGDTLRDAFTSLQEKLYDDSTAEERIEAFIKKFPEYDVKYDNRDFVYLSSCIDRFL